MAKRPRRPNADLNGVYYENVLQAVIPEPQGVEVFSLRHPEAPPIFMHVGCMVKSFVTGIEGSRWGVAGENVDRLWILNSDFVI